MRNVKLINSVLVAGCLLFVPLARGQGGNPPASTKESGQTSGRGYTAVEQTFKENVEQQVKTLQEQGRQAALKGDTSFLEKYLADDYVGIGGNGQFRTKAEAIESYKSGALKYEAIDVRNQKIRTYGDTAIVNSEASVRLTLDGKPISGDYRTTFVYVKRQGNWKQVAFQSTPVTSGSH